MPRSSPPASRRPLPALAVPPGPHGRRFALRAVPPGPRGRWSALLVGVLAAAGVWATPTQAEDDGPSTLNVFRVSYEVRTEWSHDAAYPGVTDHDAMTFAVKGELPNVVFSGPALAEGVSARVSTAVAGSAASTSNNPEGTSVDCSGDRVQVEGLAALGGGNVGPNKRGFFFAPWIVGRGTGSCKDSDGRTGPFSLSLDLPGEVTTDVRATPPGAVAFAPTFKQLDSGRWSEEFRRTYTGKACPGFDAAASTACTATVSGRLTLDRVKRDVSQDDDDDLLAPDTKVRKPKLDPKRRKATTTVRCPKACTVEPGIGVFRRRKDGTPWVDERPQRPRRLKAKQEATVTVPLTAGDRAAAKQGLAVMTLGLRMAGKHYSATYPLR